MALGSIGAVSYDVLANDRTKEGLDSAQGRAKGINKTGLAVGAGMTAVGIGAKIMSDDVNNSFMAIDTAMAGVRKTTGMSTDEIAIMKDEFIELSKTMPTAAAEFADIGAIAGQLGISGKENIMEFSQSISKMSVAFDMGAEDAATAMAKMSTIYDIPIAKVGNLGSAINILGNTTAAKERQIMDFSMSLGAGARQLGFTSTESLAMGASLISMGMDASDAGTRLNTAFRMMGEKVIEVSGFLGMETDEFRKAFGEDQMGMLKRIVTKLGEIEDPLERNTKGAAIFGAVGSKAIIGLGGNLEGLETNLKNAEAGFIENTSLEEEYANATDTVAAKLEIANNKMEAAKIQLGEGMAPATLLAADMMSGFAGILSGMPEPMAAVLGTGMKLTETMTFLGPAMMGLSNIGPAITAIKGMGGAMKTLGMTMLTPPMGVVIAIGAIILILIALEKKFGIFSKSAGIVMEALRPVAEFFTGAFSSAIEWGKDVVGTFGDKLLVFLGPIGLVVYAFKNWDKIGPMIHEALSKVYDFITTPFMKAYDWITSLPSKFMEAGKGLVKAIVDGIISLASAPYNAIKNALGPIGDLLPGSDAKEGPLSNLTASGKATLKTFNAGIESESAAPKNSFSKGITSMAPGGSGGSSGGVDGNTYAGDTLNIGPNYLSRDYDFPALMKDIENYQSSKRVQRGIRTL